MKKFRKVFALLLCLIIILMPTTTFAAIQEGADTALPNATQSQNLNAGTIRKDVGETGYYQRLPRLTELCTRCQGIAREFIPDDYVGCTYTLSNPDILTDLSFSQENYKDYSSGYGGYPSLQFNYTAAKAGTTTVTLKFYYEFNSSYETGYCSFCNQYLVCYPNTTHYYDIVRFDVTVIDNTPVLTYTVTYTDGVDGEEVFVDQVYSELAKDTDTPEFVGTPTREGYEFIGWAPEVAEKVIADATYTAQWKEKSSGGEDPDPETFTVTYTDGVDGEEVFVDQVYPELTKDTDTPEFVGTPAREGYEFIGWAPEVAEKVIADATYTAQWKEKSSGGEDPDPETFTVIYTDGVDGEEVFVDQVYNELAKDTKTPEFVGTPAREGYEFIGWAPEVAEKVIADATYTAQWKEKSSGGGDPDPETFTVTYTDGVDGVEVFKDQVYTCASGADTPAFEGTPSRDGYKFIGWNPAVAATVTADATYVAQWEKKSSGGGTYPSYPDKPTYPDRPIYSEYSANSWDFDQNFYDYKSPKTGDASRLEVWVVLMFLSLGALITALYKRAR